MKSNKFKGISLAVGGSILWGISGTVAQYLFNNFVITPVWIVGVRLLFAGLLLVTISTLQNGKAAWQIWRNKTDRRQLIAFAVFGMLASQLSYFMAIQAGNAATATILQFTGPLYIIIYLAISQHQLPRRIDAISIVVALTGTFLLVTKGHLNSLSLAPLAVIWGLLSGVSQASYTLIPRSLLQKYDAKLIVGWGMLVGSIPFLPIVTTQVPHSFAGPELVAIGYIIIFGTIFSYLFYLQSLNYIAPATTGMLSSIEPLTATTLAILLLGVKMSGIELIGAVLILATVFLQALPTKSANKEKTISNG